MTFHETSGVWPSVKHFDHHNVWQPYLAKFLVSIIPSNLIASFTASFKATSFASIVDKATTGRRFDFKLIVVQNRVNTYPLRDFFETKFPTKSEL